VRNVTVLAGGGGLERRAARVVAGLLSAITALYEIRRGCSQKDKCNCNHPVMPVIHEPLASGCQGREIAAGSITGGRGRLAKVAMAGAYLPCSRGGLVLARNGGGVQKKEKGGLISPFLSYRPGKAGRLTDSKPADVAYTSPTREII